MEILKPVDIENEIRLALKDYVDIYCRPLPENFNTPSILPRVVGGSSSNTIDTFSVVLDSRAKTEAEAIDLLNTALGILEQRAEEQFGALRNITVNSMASWGSDPVRPDLSLCTLTVLVTAHRESLKLK